jgi:GTPase
MRIRRMMVAAIIVGVAASVGGVDASASATVKPASFGATDDGEGATLALADQNARQTIEGDYGPCSNITVYAYGQNSDGTWWADVSGECSYVH